MKKNQDNSNLNNVFAILAVVLIVVALFNFGITFLKVSELKKAVTGYATGYVNITVSTSLGVVLSPDFGINWSAGGVNGGVTNATLTTGGNSSSVVGGNWSTTGVTGVMITNSGNVNVSLTINATKNNTDWFGVTGGPSAYQFNVTKAQASSCSGGVISLETWYNVNHTAIKYCAQMNSIDGSDQVWLDVKLQVPQDTANTNTLLIDTITVTANTAG